MKVRAFSDAFFAIAEDVSTIHAGVTRQALPVREWRFCRGIRKIADDAVHVLVVLVSVVKVAHLLQCYFPTFPHRVEHGLIRLGVTLH